MDVTVKDFSNLMEEKKLYDPNNDTDSPYARFESILEDVKNIEKYKLDLENKNKELKELKQQNQDYKNKNSIMTQALSEKGEYDGELEKNNEQLGKDIEKLIKNSESEQKQNREKQEEYAKENEELKMKNLKADKLYKLAIEELEKIRKEKEDISNGQNELLEKLKNLSGENNNLKEDLKHGTKTNSELMNENAKLNIIIEQQKSEYDNLKEESRKIKGAFGVKILDKKEKNQSLKREISELKKKLDNLPPENPKQSSLADQLGTTDLSDEKDDLEDVQKTTEELKNKLEEQKTINNGLKDEIKRLQKSEKDEKIGYNEMKDKLEEEYHLLRETNEKLKGKIEFLDVMIKIETKKKKIWDECLEILKSLNPANKFPRMKKLGSLIIKIQKNKTIKQLKTLVEYLEENTSSDTKKNEKIKAEKKYSSLLMEKNKIIQVERDEWNEKYLSFKTENDRLKKTLKKMEEEMQEVKNELLLKNERLETELGYNDNL